MMAAYSLTKRAAAQDRQNLYHDGNHDGTPHHDGLRLPRLITDSGENFCFSQAAPPARGGRKERNRARRAGESDEAEHASQERSDGRASGGGGRSPTGERQGDATPVGAAGRSGRAEEEDKKRKRL